MIPVTLREAVDKAIELEERGYAFYKKSEGKTEDAQGKAMFRFLAEEEVKHKQLLEKTLDGEDFDLTVMVEIPQDDEMESQVFQKEVAGGIADENADPLAALNIGVEAERASISLYAAIVEQCGDEKCRSLFRQLVSEEEKHLSILQGEIDFVTETGSYYDFKTITT
ncbi:MAG: ferritin family protein [Methanobacteriota archaeon]